MGKMQHEARHLFGKTDAVKTRHSFGETNPVQDHHLLAEEVQTQAYRSLEEEGPARTHRLLVEQVPAQVHRSPARAVLTRARRLLAGAQRKPIEHPPIQEQPDRVRIARITSCRNERDAPKKAIAQPERTRAQELQQRYHPQAQKTIPEGALSCNNGSQNRGIDAYLAKTRQEDEGARSSLTQAGAAHAPPHAQTESQSFEGT